MPKLTLIRSLMLAVLLLVSGLYFGYHQNKNVGSFTEFKRSYPLSEKYLLASDGRLISTFRTDLKKRNLAWFNLSEINSDLIHKVLAQEDHRFYEHIGVDVLALGSASLQFLDFNHKVTRGASTVSMQLAKNMNSLNTRTVYGKFLQILGALKIERSWSKNQILEAYLNLIYFHGEIQGLGSTSLALFNKSPLYLTDTEQSIILKLIKSPNSHLAQFKSSKLQTTENLAYHYQQYLLKNKIINPITTIDYDLQSFATQSLKQQIENLKNKNVNDAAILVLNNKTNQVLAYVASSGATYSKAPHVDMIQAERQSGSTLKPFLYATALENNILKINSWIEDAPVDIVYINGTYSPKNHDQHFHGWVHPGVALGSSLNVPAVKTIQLIGVDNFWSTLKKLNFNLTREPDYYGPSLALGVLDASLWQLTHAFQSLITNSPPIFSEDTRQKIIWMLSRSQNRALSFGQDSILNVPQSYAVKTGTSKDMKDNWCIGFNEHYTIGVWVGNSNNSSMQNVLGVTGAAPIWRDVVNYLNQKNKSGELLTQASLEQKLFTEEQLGPAPKTFNKNSIVSPAKNSIYAMDPEIPLKFQKIILQADGPAANLTWKFKGDVIKNNKWALQKGWQKIELYQNNEKVDETVFLVK